MKYQLKKIEEIHILTVDNLMMDYENHRLLREIENMINEDSHKYFIISLEELAFINSVGLSFLIAVLTKSRNAGGETIIVNVNEKITQLLVMTKLHSIFTVCDSTEAGIKALQASMPVLPTNV
ncbi:MAG: STAS domain-containing protein [Saprospiraceae bacterium]